MERKEDFYYNLNIVCSPNTNAKIIKSKSNNSEKNDCTVLLNSIWSRVIKLLSVIKRLNVVALAAKASKLTKFRIKSTVTLQNLARNYIGFCLTVIN